MGKIVSDYTGCFISVTHFILLGTLGTGVIMISISQIRKLKLREVESSVNNHTARS